MLHGALPAYCIPEASMMETGEIIYEEESASPRPPPKISFKDSWMKELGSEVAGGSEDSQQSQTQPRPQIQLLEHGDLDIEPEDQYSPVAFPVSKRLTSLLRHGHLRREDDGAIEFWRLKDYLRNDLVQSQHWSDEKWKCAMAKGGGNKKIFQYCTDPSGQEILCLRAFQGHSGRYSIDPSFQDNVLIPNDFFEYIYHIGCAINLHSIMNSRLRSGKQNLSKRQTVVFTSVDPVNREHKDPNKVDLEAPRLTWYKQKKVEETSEHCVLGRHQTCSTESF